MNILKRADKIVNARDEERLRQYGDFVEGMKTTSILASIMLNKPITPRDAYMVMIALKFSREAHAHKEDNLLDACAYLGSLNEYLEEARRTGRPKKGKKRR